MASRVISAKRAQSPALLKNTHGVVYGEGVTFGAAVSDHYVTGGTIEITKCSTLYDTSYYVKVYIGGSFACRSETFTHDEDRSTLSVGIDPTWSADNDVLLTSDASEVTVYFYCVANTSDEYVVSVSYESTVTITADYEFKYAACEPPQTVEVSAENAAPGTSVKLSWSDASAGSYYNPITGYWIYRATELDGTYTKWQKIDSTATSGSYTVKPPTVNGVTYYYKVQTLGAEEGYDSEISLDFAALTCDYASVGAPTVVSLAATNAAPGAAVVLTWDKATEGTNNPIKGYQVWRATSANGVYDPLGDPIETTEISGSLTVYTPETNLATYFYKVQTLGELENCDSDLSAVYATLTCTYSMPSAPTTVTVDDATSVYVLPQSRVVLQWSDASAGANNPVTGYGIYRDGVAIRTGLAVTVNSYEVESNATAGKSYSFTVVAEGRFSDSAPSLAVVVYSYTDPTPPTTVTVSESMSPVGSRVSLSWGGASAGGYNNITGYRICRASAADGDYKPVLTVVSTSDSDTCFVDASPVVGYSYYYKVETIGSYSVSDPSDVYAVVTSIEASVSDEDINVYIKPKPPRARRKMVFGEYDTDYDGPWTLCEWALSEPEAQTNYVEVPGRAAGPLDLSAYLTGGDPRYGSRELSARFECSEGTRLEREGLISLMVNQLHGQRVDIVLPDDDTRYITGRLHVTKEYNDPAHASVSVSAVCDPWRYNKWETAISLYVIDPVQEFVLPNTGRRILVPTVKVSGYGALVHLTCGGHTWTLSSGEYRLPELSLRHGNTLLSCYGSGVITFTYREAVL